MTYRSWGYIPTVKPRVRKLGWPTASFNEAAGDATSVLAYGNGRSYGDSCLNSHGHLIDMRALDRLLVFDRLQGTLTAETGITLAEILSVIVPAGWFLPVTPGTSYVTLGGAIANDVHGKNQHCDGTFGCFIQRMSVLRSEGGVHECSPDTNTALFQATIGGLGLTGLIMQATIKLMSVDSAMLDVCVDHFTGLKAFVALSQSRSDTHKYSVAWLDCVAAGSQFARGILLSANHVASDAGNEQALSLTRGNALAPTIQVPFNLPALVLNRYSLRAFNTLYYHRQRRLQSRVLRQHFRPFFYPLDAVNNWNRIYGSGGFHQYQFVVPLNALHVMEHILQRIVAAGLGSFLAVLKIFGDIPSPGILSFPRQGVCLALDFANRGPRTETLIHSLDIEVRDAGGAAYPAKDRLMSAQSFKAYFPAWEQFTSQVDPAFQSDFWQRVNE